MARPKGRKHGTVTSLAAYNPTSNDFEAATLAELGQRGAVDVAIRDSSGNLVETFGGGTQYTEDAAAAANPVGTAVNLIRQDTPAALTTTDGDNVAQRGTNYGAAFVQIVSSSGSFIDSVGGGTEYTQDAVAPANPTGGTLLGVRRDSPSSIGANGDWVAASMDEFGRLRSIGTIDGSVEVTDGGGSITIDATSLPLPSGAATSAKQDTIISHLDGVEGLLTTIDADTGNIATSVATVAGAVSGTEMQVDVVTLPTATVQGVAANGAAVSGNPVLIAGEDPSGNVARLQTASDGDLLVHQHSAATALADAVSNTMHIPINQTDAGFLGTPTAPYVYNGTTWDRLRGNATDGLTVNLGANNDVTVTSSALPSGAATSAKQDTLISHVDSLETITNSIKSNTDYGAVVGGGTETGALRVTIANDSSGVVSIDDNGSSITVDGTVAATQSGTWTEANSAAIAASLSVLDDWDESDRAKVNPIVGQAGVAAGSGTVGATVQRVTIATDDAVSTALASKYITGINHGVKTVTSAGTDEALASSTACKKVLIQAQTDNTGVIAVGASGVDATVATGTGYLMYAGDAIEMDIDNLNDVYIDATVSGDGVRYTYWT